MKRDFLELASQWPSSGITQKEFCSKHQIAYQTFQYYLRKSRRKEKPADGFVELFAKQNQLSAQSMELHFANGSRLLFFHNPDPAFIISLVK